MTQNKQVTEILQQRQFELRNTKNFKELLISNKMIIFYAVEYTKVNKLKLYFIVKINHIIVHKKLYLPCELVRMNRGK